MARQKAATLPPIVNIDLPTLALDLGRRTGWCYRDKAGVIDSGVHELYHPRGLQHAYEDGERFQALRRFMHTLEQQLEGIEIVAFEDVHPATHASSRQTQLYQGMRATVMAWAYDHGKLCLPIPVGTVKRAVTGKGNAKKQAVIEAVVSLGFKPWDDNEADAIAVLHALPMAAAEAKAAASLLEQAKAPKGRKKKKKEIA